MSIDVMLVHPVATATADAKVMRVGRRISPTVFLSRSMIARNRPRLSIALASFTTTVFSLLG